ncbi:hypothetical protein [sulfur-oxidizing endosymbiont of Gigantopelta aegis]|uniref:hypothetical protein n=1 Tax=sulfur-oxidizing endosymbiont of Gigantopelta aegis TaxID=2794934 RepID=UPI0018DB6867|nr:hypothetical protein [sulfur-oxidizing endosymbiont of Gigantopelta aegis]
MPAIEFADVVSTFHKGSDSLTQFFAEQERSDNEMLSAFDAIDQFLIIAEESAANSAQHEYFNERANELILLIDRLMVFSSQMQHQETFSYFEECLFLFTLWFASVGGIISKLIPLVNLIAAMSNRLRDQDSLKQLLANIENIIHATEQSIQDDMDDRDPRRPWRVLLLNYAITATRTHDPVLMDKTFQFLIKNLPD